MSPTRLVFFFIGGAALVGCRSSRSAAEVCKTSGEVATTWADTIPSPSGGAIAIACSQYGAGPGTAWAGTFVYLKRTDHPLAEVVELNHQTHVGVKWVDPTHLEVTYGPGEGRGVTFQAHDSLGVSVTLGQASPNRATVADTAPPVNQVAPTPHTALALDEGVFGLSSEDGTRLVAMDHVTNPSRIHTALCGLGRVYHVRFDHVQPGVPDSASPQTSDNFRHLTGSLFVPTDTIHPFSDEDCYLTADTSLARSVTPVLGGPTSDCAPTLQERLTAAKHRQVVHCWLIASAASHPILAAQFATQDTNALASIVVDAGGVLLFEDYPATYRGPDESTWRVDDQGEFSPDFRVLFLCQVRGAWLLGLTWAGAEGIDAYVLAADSSTSFREVEKTYRYTIPN